MYDYFKEKDLEFPYICSECTTLLPGLIDILKLKKCQDELEAKVVKITTDQEGHDTRITKCEVDLEDLSTRLTTLENTRNDRSEAERLQYDENLPRLTASNFLQTATPEIASIVRS